MSEVREVNYCPTCLCTVPVGFNCEDDQREQGLTPPDPCNNPTKGQRSERERLRARVERLEGDGIDARRVSNLVTALTDEMQVNGGGELTVEAARLYDEINEELGTLAREALDHTEQGGADAGE